MAIINLSAKDIPGGPLTVMLGLGLGVTAALGILKKFEVEYESKFEAGDYELENEFEFEFGRKRQKRGKK